MSSGRKRCKRSAASSAPLLARLAVAVFVLGAVGCAHQPAEPPRSTLVVVGAHAQAAPGAHAQEGMGTWYGREQHGHLTASGARFDMYALTAAHRTLPMGTRIRVTNLRNGRSVIVRINDRGPYARGRIVDVSFAAAKELEMLDAGVVPVRVEVIAR